MTADKIPAELLDLTKTGSHKFTSVLDLVGVSVRITSSPTTGGSSTGGTSGGQSSQGGQSGQTGRSSGQTGQSGQSSQTGQSGQSGQASQTGQSTGGASAQKPIVVTPAFPDDPTQAATFLTQLLDHVTVNPVPAFPGRININQASKTLLLGIPGMTSDIVDQIISNREPEFTGQHPEQQYETWLYAQAIVKLADMKALQPFITTGGSVYRGQIVGFFDDGGPSHRVEVVVDASPLNANTALSLTSPPTSTTTDQTTTGTDQTSSSSAQSSASSTSSTSTEPVIGVPRILFWRDISHLGRGFSLDTLGAAAAQ
jgi:hypothetical protein